MSAAPENSAGSAASQRGSLAPERLPEFPPRSAADVAAEQARLRKVRLQTGRRRRGFPIGFVVAVMIAAGGAGLVVALDPLAPPALKSVRVVASADAGAPVPTAVVPAEASPAVHHTGALMTATSVPTVAAGLVAEPAVIPATAPPIAPLPEPDRESLAAPAAAPEQPVPVEPPQERQPTVVASIEPPAKEALAVAPQARPAVAAAPAAQVKPAELKGLVTRGEQFLKAGDLASARLFFGRAAAAGDPRGARGMAQTFDPAVVRRLPVYGLAVDPAEAERWYATARELSSEKAIASQ